VQAEGGRRRGATLGEVPGDDTAAERNAEDLGECLVGRGRAETEATNEAWIVGAVGESEHLV